MNNLKFTDDELTEIDQILKKEQVKWQNMYLFTGTEDYDFGDLKKRHGTIQPISNEEYEHLIEHY